MDNIVKELVENPHVIWQNNINYWNFLLNSYEGGRAYTKAEVQNQTTKGSGVIKVSVNGKALENTTSTNLFQHKKELDADYQNRLIQSYYYNYCAPIVDIYTNHLFKQPIIETFGNIEGTLELRNNNIDRMDNSIQEFRINACSLAQIYGHCFALVDMPPAGGEVNLEQRMVNDQFPYITLYHPQSVLNWSLDRFGRLNWIILSETVDGNQDFASANKNQGCTTSYRVWTKTDWYLYDSDFALIETGGHALGIVPIVTVYNKPSKKVRNMLGISEIADIAFIARDIYNSLSELKQILRDQTFAFLALQGDSTEYDELSLGIGKGLLYPRETNAPQYISPPAENAEVYFKHIDRQIEKMFQLAKLEAGSVAPEGESAGSQSGVSKKWDFNQTNSTLSQKASHMQDAENKIWNLFAKWEGEKEFDGSISYPNEFSMQSLMDDLVEAQELMKVNVGKKANQEVKKAIVKKKFPRISDEDMEEMQAEIENEAPENGVRLKDRLPGLFGKKQTDNQVGN